MASAELSSPLALYSPLQINVRALKIERAPGEWRRGAGNLDRRLLSASVQGGVGFLRGGRGNPFLTLEPVRVWAAREHFECPVCECPRVSLLGLGRPLFHSAEPKRERARPAQCGTAPSQAPDTGYTPCCSRAGAACNP